MAEAVTHTGPLVELAGVVRDYGTRVITRALAGVDLIVERGELAALMGPSGSGKSTLLQVLGLLDRPTAGRVRIAGRDTASLSDRELTAFRGDTIGFVFQFHHLLPAFTALENVAMPVWGRLGRLRPGDRAHARELLVAVGLADRLDNRATDLSGGQQQRVAIARALMRDPPLLLADEPTGNLDTASGDQVFELFRRFNRERGTTCLVVTHDPRIAERCDRVIELVDGAIAADRRRR
ncbi:MAG TPA: ABC transporter ATP-binding protein [Thermoanaerobaculia bacterium]|nr:ABC transporter ATP-binding protein [Thermoanaerobaculia bacterium]